MTVEQAIATELAALLNRGVRIASDHGLIEVVDNRGMGVLIVDVGGFLYTVVLTVARRP